MLQWLKLRHQQPFLTHEKLLWLTALSLSPLRFLFRPGAIRELLQPLYLKRPLCLLILSIVPLAGPPAPLVSPSLAQLLRSSLSLLVVEIPG